MFATGNLQIDFVGKALSHCGPVAADSNGGETVRYKLHTLSHYYSLLKAITRSIG